MGEIDLEYREREDTARGHAVPDHDADAEPGAGHQGAHRVEGIEEVLQSGDRGVDWSRDSQQASLSDTEAFL